MRTLKRWQTLNMVGLFNMQRVMWGYPQGPIRFSCMWGKQNLGNSQNMSTDGSQVLWRVSKLLGSPQRAVCHQSTGGMRKRSIKHCPPVDSSGGLCRLCRLRVGDAGSVRKDLRAGGKGQGAGRSRWAEVGSGIFLGHSNSVSETDFCSGSTSDSVNFCVMVNVLLTSLSHSSWVACNGFGWDLPSLFP